MNATIPVSNDIPRRVRIDLMTPAELAIEAAGCDSRLTDAVILLQQAQSKVADYIDTPYPVRHRAIMLFTPEVLEDMDPDKALTPMPDFNGFTFPKDAKVSGFSFDWTRNAYAVGFEHPDLPACPVNYVPEIMKAQFSVNPGSGTDVAIPWIMELTAMWEQAKEAVGGAHRVGRFVLYPRYDDVD